MSFIMVICFFVAACETSQETSVNTVSESESGIQEAQAEPYNGPKARVSVTEFSNKAGNSGEWWSDEIGNGMADMLISALVNTNRYIVLDRQILDDVMREQDLGASGRIRQDTAAPVGEIEGAELTFVGAVTEYTEDASGSGGSGFFNAIGGALGSASGLGVAPSMKVSYAEMAIDVRIVDTRTTRILANTVVRGEAKDSEMGISASGYTSGYSMGGAMSSWAKTPRGKVLRQCIEQAVQFFIKQTPDNYYRHGGSVSSFDQSTPATNTQPTIQSTNSGSTTYTVQPGDTLGAIAQTTTGSSANWEAIMRHNGMNSPQELRAGQTLEIPEGL